MSGIDANITMSNPISISTDVKIVWLMSFPNSGTSFTSKLIRHVTMLSTATNYANEIVSSNPTSIESIWNESVVMKPSSSSSLLRPKNDEGHLIPKPPYWIDPHSLGNNWSRPTRLVLTKTHCGGRCEWCGPEEYIENPHSFLMQCRAGQWGRNDKKKGDKNNDTTTMKIIYYPLDRVVKAVHLIRNPLDNVVSRFHLARRKLFVERGLEVSSDREGFVKFCQLWKDTYGTQEAKMHWLDPQVYQMLEHVPCFGDFIRYIQWHNLALVVTQDLKLATMVLRYEDFEVKLNETVNLLTRFLETPSQRGFQAIEFSRGKKYHEYFTEEERRAIAAGVKQMSLWATWQHIQHYFE
jgi:hypothetical protein